MKGNRTSTPPQPEPFAELLRLGAEANRREKMADNLYAAAFSGPVRTPVEGAMRAVAAGAAGSLAPPSEDRRQIMAAMLSRSDPAAKVSGTIPSFNMPGPGGGAELVKRKPTPRPNPAPTLPVPIAERQSPFAADWKREVAEGAQRNQELARRNLAPKKLPGFGSPFTAYRKVWAKREGEADE